MSEADEARARVRRLLLSGDNILKNRDDTSRDRARRRYAEALQAARSAGLDDLEPIIALRLGDLEGGPHDHS